MSELNILLQQCEQIYRRLDGALDGWPQLRASDIPEDRRKFWGDAVLALVYVLYEIAGQLRRKTLDGGVGDVAPATWKYYRETVAPNRDRIAQLWMELHGVEGEPLVFGGTGDTICEILQTGVDLSRLDDHRYSEHEVDQAQEVLFAEWFSPKSWLKNAADIHPMLGRSAGLRIPGEVRIRLTELSRSFILGNSLAAIALARAILEYTLIDRARKLGIDPKSSDSRYPNRSKRLRELVDEVSERRPNLRDGMNDIVDAGNATLHPRKGSDVALLAGALRAKALTSIQSVHLVVEALYLE